MRGMEVEGGSDSGGGGDRPRPEAITKLTWHEAAALGDALGLPNAQGTEKDKLVRDICDKTWEQVVAAVRTLTAGEFLSPGFLKMHGRDPQKCAEKQRHNMGHGMKILGKLTHFMPASERNGGGASQGAALTAGGEGGGGAWEREDEDEWWLSLDKPRRAEPIVRHSELPVLHPSTHLMMPVDKFGELVLIINKDLALESERDLQRKTGLGYDVGVTFFVYPEARVVGDYGHLTRNLIADTKQRTGDTEFVCVTAIGYIPSFAPDGSISKNEGGQTIWQVDSRTSRNFFYWDAVHAGLRCGRFKGRSDVYLVPELADEVHDAASRLGRLFTTFTGPKDLIVELKRAGGGGEGGEALAFVRHVEGARAGGLAAGGAGGQEQQARTPEKPGREVSVTLRLIDLETSRFAAAERISDDLLQFLVQDKSGLKPALYRLARRQQKREDAEVFEILRAAGLEGLEKMPDLDKGLLIIDTVEIVRVATELWRYRTRTRDDGRCRPLELMTALILGPPAPEELQRKDNSGPVAYCQERLNLFRALLDLTMREHSREYFVGLDRALGVIAHAMGTSHSILDMFRAAYADVCTKDMTKRISSKLARRGAVVNVAHFMACKTAFLAWDNFVRNIKVGKNVGGAVGSYALHHICHISSMEAPHAPSEGKGFDLSDVDAEKGCWRCRGSGERCKEGDADYVCNADGAGMCRLCMFRPPEVVDRACLEALKTSLHCMRPVAGEEAAGGGGEGGDGEGRGDMNPFFFSMCLDNPNPSGALEAHGRKLHNLGLVLHGELTVFTATDDLVTLYAMHDTASKDRATFAAETYEGAGPAVSGRVIEAAPFDTNSPFGLLQCMAKIRTHPFIGPHLDSRFTPMMSDLKCYQIMERLMYQQGVHQGRLCMLFPYGLRGANCMDTGLHVIAIHTEWIMRTYSSVMKLYFDGLVQREGTGQFFEKMRLSTMLTVQSVVFQAHCSPDVNGFLLQLAYEFPGDRAVSALVMLHQMHIPLCLVYMHCFSIARKSDLHRRRELFDLWLELLLPLMIVCIQQLGGDEYGRVLVQVVCKVYWWKEHERSMFSFCRDNFGVFFDSTFIELTHSFIANNFPFVNTRTSDYDQTRWSFLSKDSMQAAKSRISSILGVLPRKIPRTDEAREQLEDDVNGVKALMFKIFTEVRCEIEAYKREGKGRSKSIKGNREVHYSAGLGGAITQAMCPPTTPIDDVFENLAKRVSELWRSGGDSDAINELCAGVDLTRKQDFGDEGIFAAAFKHFVEPDDKNPTKGRTRMVKRQATQVKLSLAQKFPVIHPDRVKELVWDDEGKDSDITDIVDALVSTLPGGDTAFKRLKEQGPPAELSSCHDRMLLGVMQVDNRACVIEFDLGRSAAASAFNYGRAADEVSFNSAAIPDGVLCGDIRIENSENKAPADLIAELHEKIQGIVQQAALDCMTLLAAGYTDVAIDFSGTMSRATNGEACNIIEPATDRAIFAVINAYSHTVVALLLKLDGVRIEGCEGETPTVEHHLVEARDTLEDILAGLRPVTKRPMIASVGDKGQNLRQSVTKTLAFVEGLLSAGETSFPQRAHGGLRNGTLGDDESDSDDNEMADDGA